MKNYFYTLFILGFCQFMALGQESIQIDSEIKSVIVYTRGAQISRTAHAEIPSGKSTLVFDHITYQMNPEGIQIKATNDELMIISVSHEVDYGDLVEQDEEIKIIADRQLEIRDSIKYIKEKKELYKIEKNMILSNQSIGGKDGVSIIELEKAANFFRTRLNEIGTALNLLEKDVFQLRKKLVNISNQLLVLNAKEELPTSKIIVVVSSKTMIQSDFEIKYIVNQSGWSPKYDVRIKDVDSPLDLIYKSMVWQDTDEEWKDVKLTLSTGNPTVSNQKPDLSKYLLSFNNYYKKNRTRMVNKAPKNRNRERWIAGSVKDNEGEILIGANVLVNGTGIGTITDIQGNFQLSVPNDFNVLTVSYIGYATQEVNINSRVVDIRLSESVALSEVVITSLAYRDVTALASSRAGVTSYNLDGVRMRGDINTKRKRKLKKQIPLAINKYETSISFDIEVPYTIPSDNKPYDVSMLSYEIDAIYNYRIVPKLSDDAFLMASLIDWTDYDLLSGEVSLFFKGVYQGKTYLDVKQLEDTLSFSVGRDKDIIVERTLLKDYTSRRFLGSYKKVQKAWEINIKNNKSKQIKLIVEDQYPISTVKDIEVELVEDAGAKVEESSGKLIWEIDLAANEKTKKTVIYTVKYPKKRRLLVE